MVDPPQRAQRHTGGSGGSMQTTPSRRTTARERVTPLERAKATLGADIVNQLQTTYKTLDSRWGGPEHAQAEGMILALLRQGLPDAQVRAVFGVGGYKITRLKAMIENGIDDFHTRRSPQLPKHAFTDEDIDFFLSTCSDWELEDGFPCSHRRPRQYFVEPGITWKLLWQRHSAKALEANQRGMKYSRWTQYVHMHFPGVRLSRTKEDLCDACVRLEVALLDPNLSEADRAALQAEKELHLEAAINQRRAMSDFVRQYVAASAPQQTTPAEVIADHGEVPIATEPDLQCSIPTIQIQIEDFGGSFPLPVYGLKRPSADYFNSNLLMHNFIIADVTHGINHVLLYDERAQGKGADALCSLRLMYHLQQRNTYLHAGQNNPESSHFLMHILDNCVGQNKSRVVFMFYAMLSLVFYEKVVLLYLLPGHSHNAADRVVAWCRRKMKAVNIYSPEEIVSKLNETSSVRASFLDHRSGDRPFYCGWDALLAKYFKKMPSSYTNNYFFEIDNGIVTMRHLVTTDESQAESFSLIGGGDPNMIRQAFIADLFGTGADINSVSMSDVQLQRQPELTLTLKKLKSLSMKYFSIPPAYISYYPVLPQSPENEASEKRPQQNEVPSSSTTKRKLAVGVAAKRPVGRPSKRPAETKNPSILSYFKPVRSGSGTPLTAHRTPTTTTTCIDDAVVASAATCAVTPAETTESSCASNTSVNNDAVFTTEKNLGLRLNPTSQVRTVGAPATSTQIKTADACANVIDSDTFSEAVPTSNKDISHKLRSKKKASGSRCPDA